MTDLYDFYKFIGQADLAQCRDIAAVLGARLFAIEKQIPKSARAEVNESANLMADVLLDLSKAVESKEEPYKAKICSHCNGSGQSGYGQESCWFCKGRGTV